MADFAAVGKMRGVGWAICYQDPGTGAISNHWITLHEHGNISGFIPILVMDVWEHAFILDYAPSDRQKYIDAFFSNVDWDAVQGRLKGKIVAPAAEPLERWLGKNLLHAPDDPAIQHDFDSVRVIRGLCENPLNDAFCQLPGALILLFHDPDSKSGSNVGASLSVHCCAIFSE